MTTTTSDRKDGSSSTTAPPRSPTYRVVHSHRPITIQIRGNAPEKYPVRTLGSGDVLPTWAEAEHVQHLLEMGAIEVVEAVA